MSTYRSYETKRGRLKLSKNLSRTYRESKCRDCRVIVTPMDFAKILGKFTKVKIQYETCNTKSANDQEMVSPNSNARLKSNENGMVLIHRNAYHQHPVKEIYSPKKQKQTKITNNTSKQHNNILKENNRLKKTPLKDKNSNYNKKQQNNVPRNSKQYGITFNYPQSNSDDKKNQISLSELLPLIDNTILPSDDWNIDYFPKDEEPKEDKVYDRIAAELEDLMCNDDVIRQQSVDHKVEEFPSIMDILNDTTSNNHKLNEANDVEAMLLGNTVTNKSVPMDVDKIDETDVKLTDREGSPSILNEDPQKDLEIFPDKLNSTINDSLFKETSQDTEINSDKPNIDTQNNNENVNDTKIIDKNVVNASQNSDSVATDKCESKLKNTTHVVFKHMENGKCNRSVMCPKSLMYSIELEGKSVELQGAPKFISSLEDLQVLLEIVNESELNSFYVLH